MRIRITLRRNARDIQNAKLGLHSVHKIRKSKVRSFSVGLIDSQGTMLCADPLDLPEFKGPIEKGKEDVWADKRRFVQGDERLSRIVTVCALFAFVWTNGRPFQRQNDRLCTAKLLCTNGCHLRQTVVILARRPLLCPNACLSEADGLLTADQAGSCVTPFPQQEQLHVHSRSVQERATTGHCILNGCPPSLYPRVSRSSFITEVNECRERVSNWARWHYLPQRWRNSAVRKGIVARRSKICRLSLSSFSPILLMCWTWIYRACDSFSGSGWRRSPGPLDRFCMLTISSKGCG
jgi:hypothetical protein